MAISAVGTINFKTLSQLTALKQLVDGIESVIVTTAEFQAQMSSVAAVSNATGQEMEALAVRARDLGATTVLTATQAGKGMEELSRLGFDVNEIFLSVQGTLNLAVSSALGLGRASQIAAGGVRAFGLGAEGVNRVVDVLANTAANTGATVDNLGESLSTAGAIADTAGLSFEEFSAFIGVLGDRLIRGSQAGTNFRQFIVGLSTEVPKGRQALKRLGLTYDDVNVSTEGLLKVLQNLEGAFDRLSSRQERISVAADLWGRRQFNAALVAINSVDKFEKLIDVYKRGEGAAKRMADIMQDNLAGSFKLAQSAAQEMALTVGGELSPNLRALLGDFTDTARAAADSGELLKNTGKVLGTIVTSLGIVAKGINVAGRTTAAAIATVLQTLANGVLKIAEFTEIFSDKLQDLGFRDAAEFLRVDSLAWQKSFDEFFDGFQPNIDRIGELALSIDDDFSALGETWKDAGSTAKVDLGDFNFIVQEGLKSIASVIGKGAISIEEKSKVLQNAMNLGMVLRAINQDDLTGEQVKILSSNIDKIVGLFEDKKIPMDASVLDFRKTLSGIGEAVKSEADAAGDAADDLDNTLSDIVTLVTSSGDKIKVKFNDIQDSISELLGFDEEEMLRKAAVLQGVLEEISNFEITLDVEGREKLREQISLVVEDFRALKRNVPPLIEEAARSFNILVTKFGEVEDASERTAIVITKDTGTMVSNIDEVSKSTDGAGKSFFTMGSTIKSVSEDSVRVIKEIDEVTGKTSIRFVDSATKISEGASKMGTGLSQAGEGSDELKGKQEGLTTSVGRSRVEIAQMAAAASTAKFNLRQAAEATRELADSGSGLESSMDSSEKKVASLSERAAEAGIKLKDLGKLVVSPKVDAKSILEYIANVEKALQLTEQLEAKS